MKKLTLLCLLIPYFAGAVPYCLRINAASTSIPTSFAGSNGALQVASSMYAVQTVMIANHATGEIAVNCAQSASNGVTPATPSDNSNYNIYITPAEAWALPPATGIGNACYMRSMTGLTISSGVVDVCLIGAAK